jgi:outer membrane protein
MELAAGGNFEELCRRIVNRYIMRKTTASKKRLKCLAIILLPTFFLCAQNETTRTLSVNEMFRLASENSKQLKLSYSGIATARKMTDVEKNKRLPTLGASLSLSYLGNGTLFNRDFSSATVAPNPHFQNNFAIEAAEVLFAGGAISNSIAKAQLQEQMAALDFDKEKLEVRLLLVGTYLDMYKLMNQREVYQKYIEQTNRLIEQVKSKRQVGMSLENDITRYELQLKQTELALTSINNNCRMLNNQLVTVLGLPDSVRILPDSKVLNTTLNDRSLPELVSDASTHLPELQAADIQHKIAEKEFKISKASYLPTLSLVGVNYLNGPILIEIPTIDKNYNYWYVGIGINYNLSSLYTSKRNVNVAKQRQIVADLEKQVVKEQSDLAIKNALIQYNETFDNLNTSEKSLLLAKQNYEVVNNRYINNLVLITEMLDAGNQKLNAELQVVNARIDILFNYYKIKRLIGTL